MTGFFIPPLPARSPAAEGNWSCTEVTPQLEKRAAIAAIASLVCAGVKGGRPMCQ